MHLFWKFRDAILNVAGDDGSASVMPESTEIHRSVQRVEDKPGKGQTWAQVVTAGNK